MIQALIASETNAFGKGSHMVDLGRAFRAPFDDPKWVNKTLMGFVWMLLGVTAPAVYGAELDYIRSVSRGDETLPEWDEFGRKWVQGLLVSVAGFIYFLPIVILGSVMLLPAVFAALASGGDFGNMGDSLVGLFAGGFCLFWVIAVVYAVAVSVLFSAATVHFALEDRFSAFFEIGAIMGHVKDGTGYLMAWAYTLVIAVAGSIGMSIVSSVTGGIGGILYPAVGYLMAMMTGHILGRWAALSYQIAASGPAPASGVPYAPPPAPAPVAPMAPPAPPAASAPPAPPAPPAPDAPPAPPAPQAPEPQEPEST